MPDVSRVVRTIDLPSGGSVQFYPDGGASILMAPGIHGQASVYLYPEDMDMLALRIGIK